MKVKEIMRKINAKTARLPVYLRNSISLESRKAESWDFGNYYYDEKDATVKSIEINEDKIIIYYIYNFQK